MESVQMATSGEKLIKFLEEALRDDPVCTCGHRKHRHSDSGPCYDCPNCDFFAEVIEVD